MVEDCVTSTSLANRSNVMKVGKMVIAPSWRGSLTLKQERSGKGSRWEKVAVCNQNWVKGIWWSGRRRRTNFLYVLAST